MEGRVDIYKTGNFSDIMNQFSHSCVPYEVRKLAALAQALIA
jgi:hypothetical protein